LVKKKQDVVEPADAASRNTADTGLNSENTSSESQNINTEKPEIKELNVDEIKEKEPLKKYVVPKKSIADKGVEIDILETIPVSGDFNVDFQTDRITRKNLEELNKDLSKDNYDYEELLNNYTRRFNNRSSSLSGWEIKARKDYFKNDKKINLDLFPEKVLRKYQTEDNFDDLKI